MNERFTVPGLGGVVGGDGGGMGADDRGRYLRFCSFDYEFISAASPSSSSSSSSSDWYCFVGERRRWPGKHEFADGKRQERETDDNTVRRIRSRARADNVPGEPTKRGLARKPCERRRLARKRRKKFNFFFSAEPVFPTRLRWCFKSKIFSFVYQSLSDLAPGDERLHRKSLPERDGDNIRRITGIARYREALLLEKH